MRGNSAVGIRTAIFKVTANLYNGDEPTKHSHPTACRHVGVLAKIDIAGEQHTHNHLETLDWGRNAAGPLLPTDVIARTSAKPMEVYELLTILKFADGEPSTVL